MANFKVCLNVLRVSPGTPTRKKPNGRIPSDHTILVNLTGVIVNILNPKTALFFLAFLPQFVDRHHAAAPQIALLGLIFVAMAWLSDSLYATVAGALRGLLARSRRAEGVERVVSGSVFVGLGLLAADAQAPTSR